MCIIQWGYKKELSCEKIGEDDETFTVTYYAPYYYGSKSDASSACSLKSIGCGPNAISTAVPLCSLYNNGYKEIVYTRTCE